MKVFYILLIVFSFFAGWYLRPVLTTGLSKHEPDTLVTASAEGLSNYIENDNASSEVIHSRGSLDGASLIESSRSAFQGSLGETMDQYLAADEFSDAVAVIDQAVSTEDDAALHRQLQAYLRGLMMDEPERFLRLADAYLNHFYDSAAGLLLLAEHQQRQGLFVDALTTLQLVHQFAYETADLMAFQKQLLSLLSMTDQTLAQQQSWFDLARFYEDVINLGLEKDADKLRLAELYVRLEDASSAELLLEALLEGPVSQGTRERAKVLLSQLQQGEDILETPRGWAVPLDKRGNHYVVELGINDQHILRLMIDTGASVTSLSQASFDRLNSYTRMEFLNNATFKTANGDAQAEIYRAESARLGEGRIDNPIVAVIPNFQEDGIDGLLGMNILQNYRFEIRQDKQQLWLQTRK